MNTAYDTAADNSAKRAPAKKTQTNRGGTKAYKDNSGFAKLIVAFTVVTLALAIIVAVMANELNKKNLILENNYSQSLYDASANLDNIEVKLSKFTVSNSDTQKLLLANDIWRQSQNVAADLAALPLDHSSVVNTTRFVNQLGDYTYYLGKKLSEKQKVTDDEMLVLEDFYSNCAIVNQEMKQLLGKMGSKYKIINHLDEQKALTPKDTLSGNFDKMQKQLEDYPELIYDGPFSDGHAKKEYKCLNNLEAITIEQGEEAVRALLDNYNITNLDSRGVADDAENEAFKFFEYAATINGNREAYVQLSQKGGKPIMFSSIRSTSRNTLDGDAAKQIAVDFAKKAGYGELKPVWIDINGGIAFINLVPEINGVVIYPDLVKVKVALDDGEVLGLEATSYLLHHVERNGGDLRPNISENTAKSMVSSKLEISNLRLALIPKSSGQEVLTYEAFCENGGLSFIIYINAYDGAEEEILRVVDTEQGTLIE